MAADDAPVETGPHEPTRSVSGTDPEANGEGRATDTAPAHPELNGGLPGAEVEERRQPAGESTVAEPAPARPEGSGDSEPAGGLVPSGSLPVQAGQPAGDTGPTDVAPARPELGRDRRPAGPDGSPDSPTDVIPPVVARQNPTEPLPPVPGEPPDTTDRGGDQPPTDPGPKKRKRRKLSFWQELPILLVVAFGLAVLLQSFVIKAFFIPSGSMERTLHGCPGCSGDKVLVNRFMGHFTDPAPGDIVVFRGSGSWEPEVTVSEPGNPFSAALRWLGQSVGVAPPDEKDFIKRVIAVGGQTVSCCDAQGRVVVDGHALDEPYVFNSTSGAAQPFGPVTVPEGRLWVMGDHRDGSADSRAHISDPDHGTIAVDDVIGKAFVIVWPPSRWDTLGTPETFENLSVGAPYALGLVGAVPVVWARRRWRRRR